MSNAMNFIQAGLDSGKHGKVRICLSDAHRNENFWAKSGGEVANISISMGGGRMLSETDLYHAAPKILELMAFERGQLP